MALLEVKNLSIQIGNRPVVQNVSFALQPGDTLGIVGESGCGKSITSLAIMGLLQETVVRITAGEILFEGRDLLSLDARNRRALMGSEIAMIFQEPMTSLNPVYRVGDQVIEAVRQHRTCSKKEAREKARQLFELVKIPDPERRLESYPHQLSGGLRQRVMIAMALSGDPALLIADEPTTALDVTVQSQILDLLKELQDKRGMAVMLISHDLGVISENCQSVIVMYRGRIVEASDSESLFRMPLHPYTFGLLKSLPDVSSEVETLEAIPGRVPGLDEDIPGCAFHPRCAFVQPDCRELAPEIAVHGRRQVSCHHPVVEYLL
ncbi:MAG: peptide ABC transporter ATP-binding protein [Hyphomicrobiales bacterium]|nr:MAG: peptide ABC transporter ATP-binding protein [Hyphomicrobiales bacterium]